jgi:hypothetical protein
MSENTERAIKNGQSRETGNIGYTRRRKTKQKHNTICVWHHHTQRNTYNVNKTWALSQTTEPNIVLMRNSYRTSQHGTHNLQTLNRTTQTAKINVREYRRGNYKRTIQRNWQHRLHIIRWDQRLKCPDNQQLILFIMGTHIHRIWFWFDFWCFNATFSNISAISWRSVLVVEEAGVPGENHRPWASNW